MTHFEEHQRFTQVWLWALLIGLMGVMTWAFVQQILSGEPFTPMPATNILVWILIPLCGIGIPLFILLIRLHTVVTDEEVQVRLRPFPRRRIPLEQITHCEARTYRPIREYGGWGLRYGFGRGWAYNVKGNQGVQLELESAKPLLIGSQRSTDLAAMINTRRALRRGG